MYHVPVNAHLSQAGCHCNQLVRDNPELACADPVHLHRKSHSRIRCPHATVSESHHNAVGYFVYVLARVVKFNIRHRPGRTANRLSVHAQDETDQCPGPRIKSHDIRALIAQLRSVDFDEADIVRACIETQLTQPSTIERGRPRLSRC